MSQRVSHSLLDPWLVPWVPTLYRLLHIPPWVWPEAIVLSGHLLAIVAAVGFAWSADAWWGGLLVALGVAGNHLADMVDGTHARATNQCRNGGELLDHFTDPLSFAYWIIGLGVACQNLGMALAGVVVMYATAVLTNIKAKLVGRFTLARFGPTEMKTLFVLYGLAISAVTAGGSLAGFLPEQLAWGFLALMLLVGIVQLVVNLVLAVREVNRHGSAPDTTDWQLAGRSQAPRPVESKSTSRNVP